MESAPEKEHICTRMVKFLEQEGIIIGKWEAENGISGGYLRRSAKDRTNIGIDLIDNFLEKFPHVDVNWLITGRHLHPQSPEKHTAGRKSSEPAVVEVLEKTVSILREENMKLLNIVELSLKRRGPDSA